MKNFFVSAIMCLVCMAGANAGCGGMPPSNMAGMNSAMITVDQVKNLDDNTQVVLVGNIVENSGDEEYVFQDATGKITVEIDEEDWNGQNFGPQETIKIYGTTDKGWFVSEIDVDSVQKM